MKNKYCFIITLIFVLSKAAVSQPCLPALRTKSTSEGGPAGRVAGWLAKDPFEQKSFIENKGQFERVASAKVLYGAENNGSNIYFTADGLFYYYQKVEVPEQIQHEMMKEEEEKEADRSQFDKRELEHLEIINKYTHKQLIGMQWVGANRGSLLTPVHQREEYFTYPESGNTDGSPPRTIKAFAFEKLLYKDIYPNIDVEYRFYEKGGVKYNVILHPGADPSQIKMKWSGSGKELSKDLEGNMHIHTYFGDIVDHAPSTYYEESGSVIASSFILHGNTISFELSNYDNSRTVIIDPWVTNPSFAGVNKAYDIERDGAGNIYAYGSLANFQIKKFNAAGVPQWTFIPAGFSQWKGDLAVDFSGNSYASVHLGPGSGANIVKVSPAGILAWGKGYLYPWLTLNNSEPGTLIIDASRNNLLVAGGNGSPTISEINLSTGADVPALYYSGATNLKEIRSITQSFNGHFYAVTCADVGAAVLPVGLLGINNSLTGNQTLFANANTGHNWGYHTPLYVHATVAPWGTHAGSQNGIAATFCYVYSFDGSLLKKWNIKTGTLVSTVTVPAGIASQNSGIVADSCDNVYVGSANAIVKYDNNMAFVTSVATTGAVYDLAFGVNNEILAAGNGFISSVAGLVQICPVIPQLNVSAAFASPPCGGTCIGTATATAAGGVPGYSYSWSNGQTTVTATGLCAGTYTVSVADASCSQVKTAVINLGPVTLNTTKVDRFCSGNNIASATVLPAGGSGPYTYSWQPSGQTTQTAVGLSEGVYTVTVRDNNGCAVSKTVSIDQLQPIPAIQSSTNISCSSNGSASINISGGTQTPPYAYSWSNGWAGTSSVSGLAVGNYTVSVTDGNGCSATRSFNITSTSTVSATFIYSSACIGSLVNFTNTGTPPGTGVTYNWVVSPITPANVSGTTTDFSYTFISAGTYSVEHTVTISGCTNKVTNSITVTNCTGPNVTATGSSVCPGSCATVKSSGSGGSSPYTYSWSNGATTQNISPCPASTTTYTVTIRDAGGSTSTSTAVVTINPAVTVTVTSTNITCNGSANGSATAAGSSGSLPYVYTWSTGATTSQVSGLTSQIYTVTITDAKSCTATATGVVTSPSALSGQFAKGTAACAGCGCKEWIMLNAAGGTSPYTYSWPDGYVNRYKNQLCPGAYLVNITDKNGCSVNVSLTAP